MNPAPHLRTLARLQTRTEHGMKVSDTRDAAARTRLREALERELLDSIPLARAMQLRISGWDAATLSLSAPLAPNVNDKGCAFGGSLASTLTLAGWALIRLATDLRQTGCDIYVQDSTIRYLAPVWGDFTAVARLDDDDGFDEFFATLKARGKARLGVRCAVAAVDGTPACVLTARFVALAGEHAPRARDAAQCSAEVQA